MLPSFSALWSTSLLGVFLNLFKSDTDSVYDYDGSVSVG